MSLKLYEQESHLPVVSRNICRAAYALINSFILNSIGMGSGVIVNVLLYQMLEAALIGLFFHTKHAKKTYAAIIVYILLFSAFVLYVPRKHDSRQKPDGLSGIQL